MRTPNVIDDLWLGVVNALAQDNVTDRVSFCKLLETSNFCRTENPRCSVRTRRSMSQPKIDIIHYNTAISFGLVRSEIELLPSSLCRSNSRISVSSPMRVLVCCRICYVQIYIPMHVNHSAIFRSVRHLSFGLTGALPSCLITLAANLITV